MNTQNTKQLLVEVTPPGEEYEQNILDENLVKKEKQEEEQEQ